MPNTDFIYCTGYTSNGQALCGGVFRLKDQEGFPVSSSHDYVQSKGALIDWMEYLADAGSQDDWKFDAALDEMRRVIGEAGDEVYMRFKVMFTNHHVNGKTFQDTCKALLEDKRSKAPEYTYIYECKTDVKTL